MPAIGDRILVRLPEDRSRRVRSGAIHAISLARFRTGSTFRFRRPPRDEPIGKAGRLGCGQGPRWAEADRTGRPPRTFVDAEGRR